MASNPFDQFDAKQNPFDQFDEVSGGAASVNGSESLSVQPKQQSVMDRINEVVLSTPGGKELSELAASANKSIFQMIDFLGPDNVNAALDLVGSDKRMPTLSENLASDGGYMEEGLGRDIARSTGEVLPMALGVGQVLRSAASNMPAVKMASESASKGVVRQMGQSTAPQDAAAGALAAIGGELGEEVAGADGKLVGAIAAPLAGASIASLGKEAVKSSFRKGSNKALSQAVDDFSEVGASPTLGQATGDPLRQAIETRSAQVFGGGSVRKSVDRTVSKMQTRLKQISDDISRTSGDVEAGRTIQKGIIGNDGFVSRFQAKSGDLWKKFDSLIASDAPVSAGNTREVLNKLLNTSQVGKIFNNPIISRVRDALEESGGQIDYKTFRELRTAIGAKLGSKDLISDIPRAELKQLYGALSQDLKAVAREGGEEAVKALTRANKYTSAGHSRLDDFVERIATKVDLDKVFSAVARGGEGTQSLNAIKRSLKPEEWEAVSANVIRQLGRANNSRQDMAGEVFSVDKFLTDWNKLGSAKKVLFSGSKKLNEYSKNLDKIARIAERVKQAGSEGANYSGTGQMLANSGIGAGIVGGAVTGNFAASGGLIAAVAANKGAATLMTNPRFVKWLAQSSTVKDLPAHIARLEPIANSEGIMNEAKDLLLDLTTQQQAEINASTNNK